MIKYILKLFYNIILKYNRLYRCITRSFDPEMNYILRVVKHKRIAIDIGSNVGIYSVYLSKHFNKVYAFEPLYKASKYLENKRIPNVIIHNIALSNTNGQKEFFIPKKIGVSRYGNSSFERSIHHKYDEVDKIQVKTNTLDSYKFSMVDFIKIDVEGHEKQTLEGCIDTINKNRPVILIEIEERHLPEDLTINDIFNILLRLNYSGYYIYNKSLISIEDFNVDKHQRLYTKSNRIKLSVREKSEIYINNFFFLPN